MFKYWKLFERKDKALIIFLIIFTIVLTIFAFWDKEYMVIFASFAFIFNICFLYIVNVYEILMDESHESNLEAINLIENLTKDNIEQQKQITELKKMLSKAKAKKKNKEEK